MKNSSIVSAALIGLGLLGAGYFVKAGIVATRGARTIDVRGLAEQSVKSDKASLEIRFNVTGETLETVYPAVTQAQGKIREFLVAQGFEVAEIQNGSTTLSDSQTDQYNSGKKGARFVARSTVLVVSEKVDVVIKSAENGPELLKLGVPFEGLQKKFFFTKLNEIKPQMLKEAAQNARQAAESLAADVGVGLGELRNASQGLFSIESDSADWDVASSVNKKVRVVTQSVFLIE